MAFPFPNRAISHSKTAKTSPCSANALHFYSDNLVSTTNINTLLCIIYELHVMSISNIGKLTRVVSIEGVVHILNRTSTSHIYVQPCIYVALTVYQAVIDKGKPA